MATIKYNVYTTRIYIQTHSVSYPIFYSKIRMVRSLKCILFLYLIIVPLLIIHMRKKKKMIITIFVERVKNSKLLVVCALEWPRKSISCCIIWFTPTFFSFWCEDHVCKVSLWYILKKSCLHELIVVHRKYHIIPWKMMFLVNIKMPSHN